MPGKDARLRAALDDQARTILTLFEAAGFAPVEPDILQPADIFLDRSGEDIRARTYVFTDPGGAELCLRPDLTVPTCRFYLEQGPKDFGEVRYCYSGPAFRYQPGGADGMHPREFGQLGLEHFGDDDPDAADVEILALTVEAVRRAGLQDFRIKVGDLRLFTALLESIDMPARWRQRLAHHFWRPQMFRETLARLSGAEPFDALRAAGIDQRSLGGSLDEASQAVAAVLEGRGLAMTGNRSVRDVARRLREKAADRTAPPLPKATVQLIERYVAVVGNPRDALHRIMNLVVRAGMTMSLPLAAFARRITILNERGIEISACRFEADFGRTLEYYTGFVFQLEVDTPAGPVPVAGGGRYDSLLSDIGCPRAVPAVGCAIHTERLLAAVEAGAR
jgi:ATP phosphoribosyltransferase regulatory subunit